MANVLIYTAHPGRRYSHVNTALDAAASATDATCVDLMADYPRHNINVEREQERLLAHDTILFQFPLFWYSTPSIIKEWQDLVLEHGWAYGSNGTQLKGKTMMLAITAGGSADAYGKSGYNHFDLRMFLTPLEQTARLCGMTFLPPYVLFGALGAEKTDLLTNHVAGYTQLINGLCNDTYDRAAAAKNDLIFADTIPDLVKG